MSLGEKPANPKHDYAVKGLYLYDAKGFESAKSLKTFIFGEMDISDLNKIYFVDYEISKGTLGRGYAGLDLGTVNSLKKLPRW